MATHPSIPAPEDATRTSDWLEDAHGRRVRFFDGTRRQSEDCRVDIFGVQEADGSVRARMIRIRITGEKEADIRTDTGEVRRMAAYCYAAAGDDAELLEAARCFSPLLVAAADEIDSLSVPNEMVTA